MIDFRRIGTFLAMLLLVYPTCFAFNGAKKQAALERENTALMSPLVTATLNGQPVASTYSYEFDPTHGVASVKVNVTSQSISPTSPLVDSGDSSSKPIFLFCLIILIAGLAVIFLIHKGVFGKKLQAMESNIATKIENEVSKLRTELSKTPKATGTSSTT